VGLFYRRQILRQVVHVGQPRKNFIRGYVDFLTLLILRHTDSFSGRQFLVAGILTIDRNEPPDFYA